MGHHPTNHNLTVGRCAGEQIADGQCLLVYAPDADATGEQWRQLPPAERIEVAATSLRMLADPTRLRMLWLLCGADYDVTSLASAVSIARPAVSQHLAKLRLAGLVSTRRDGRRALYRATGGHVRRMLAEALEHAHHQSAGIPDHD